MKYQILTPALFNDYQLLDSGNGKKLERFGKLKLIRPEPHALWKPQLEWSEWQSIAHAQFNSSDGQKGKWEYFKETPSTWSMQYKSPELALNFQLKLTSFKHVGLFPEQCVHWDYIHRSCRRKRGAKVLNLFAYTGGASLAAKAGGADVIHLESMKPIVSWARQNMEMNKMEGIRWLIEDAVRFLKREAKRGNKYSGVILDPPSFGLGPNGERFILEDQLTTLVSLVGQVLERDAFVVCNSYSFKFSALTLANMFSGHLPGKVQMEAGELASSFGKNGMLSHGVFYRARNYE